MNHPVRLPAICVGIASTAALVLAACSGAKPTAAPNTMPQLGTADAHGIVVKSRAIVRIAPNGSHQVLAIQVEPTPTPSATSGTQDIEVTNAASTSMTLDNTGWIVPTVDNAVIDFGTLAIATLEDNNLNVCGAAANEHCGAAMIRTYTIGKPGAGVWNDVDQYGAPLMASLTGTPAMGVVGLNPEGAVVLQSFEIPASKHVVRLSDFVPTPRYDVKADFTDAGAGAYSTTLVIEYALAASMPAPTPSDTPTPVPSDTPVPTPSETPAPVPTETPAPVPTETPAPVPTVTPIPEPTVVPVPVPTFTTVPVPVPTVTVTPTLLKK